MARSRYDLPATFLSLPLLGFLSVFLIWPLIYVFVQAFWHDGGVTFTFFGTIARTPVLRESIANSFKIAAVTTLLTTALALPLAHIVTRYTFRGKAVLASLLLVPMVMPPFVGAIGMLKVFARFGSLNLLLKQWGLIEQPIDWIGAGGFWGVVILEVLHLYPIMYLNVAAALANVDPTLEEAARSCGASERRLFRTVTFPLMLPGYFAGAIIVFIWAFTDLGTPLVFGYRSVVPVKIFDMVTDIRTNPAGYALVVIVIALTAGVFAISKGLIGSRSVATIARGHITSRERAVGRGRSSAAAAFMILVIAVALVPHISVLITSVAERWFMTPLPTEWTGLYYKLAVTHKNALPSIKNSLFLSSLSTVGDIVLGITVAFLITRRRIPWRGFLDVLVMLPLALPGVVVAFGYVGCFSGGPLDPRDNPMPLLVISYAIRRLPYMVRSAVAGFQQTSVTLEEASASLGASTSTTLRLITLPLVMANLVAGGVLCFAFAMLEVSDSLILAFKDQYFPIAKAIYILLQRIDDGPYIAAAMGMLGMALLTVSLVLAGKILGRRMGELFRA